jgi:hypothetical protein
MVVEGVTPQGRACMLRPMLGALPSPASLLGARVPAILLHGFGAAPLARRCSEKKYDGLLFPTGGTLPPQRRIAA